MIAILFEDELWRNFTPLIYTRPIFDLRCGAFSLRERVTAFFAANAPQDQPKVLGLCRPYLMDCYGPQGGLRTFLSKSAPLTFLNGRTLDPSWLPALLEEPLETVYSAGGILLGARLSPALASAILYYLREQRATEALEELQRFARVVEIPAPLLLYPWDLISQVGEQIIRDLPLLTPRIPRYVQTESTLVVRGAANLYVAPTAQLEGPLVLDARNGPIIIDEKAHLEPFTFIQGPAYIGVGSLISSAKLRGETSIGPVCRIGGEVEASIVQGFSNKHHDGFLGHSWLGEWVNVGALATNSDLKNTYGPIRVVIEGLGQVNSGTQKLGCFLADHVKLGIGLHLTGGAVIGVGSNLFGVHMVPKTVPPFTWGSEVFREYRIDGMIEVTRKVMSRRNQVMSPAYEAMLRTVFLLTRNSRGGLGPVPRQGLFGGKNERDDGPGGQLLRL